MAQIAAEVRKTISKYPKKIDVKDFVFNFGKARGRVSSDVKTSKAFWLDKVGVDEVKRKE